MPNITKEEFQQRVEEFLEAHKADYDEREYNYIKNSSHWGYDCENGFLLTDILRQIYSQVGVLPKEKNMYHGFIELLEENFDINREIVEVAGGIVPALAKQIALKQKSGTITVYDPRVIKLEDSPENLIVERQMFNKDTKIPNAQMIIGFMPGEAAIDIIETACQNDLDFMVALCDGGNRKGYEYLEEDDEWTGMVEYIAEHSMKNKNMGKLGVTYLKKYGNPYPVIYNNR